MRILIADDEENIREPMAQYLRAGGLEVITAKDGSAARQVLEAETVDCVVTDLRMPKLDGLGLLSWISEAGLAVPTVMISAYGEVSDAVQAMKRGAKDYLVKPFDPEELALRVRRLVEEASLQSRYEYQTRNEALAAPEGVWLGDSSAMKEVRQLVTKVAATPATVLITGESGTGKEVVARLIHQESNRAAGPFVAVNLGGVAETLIDSELFGHEKGAFTGAVDRKRGMFELASGGTLFLDEIGDLPLHLQVKLLRVLQEKKVQRVGGTQQLPIDSRIITATNRDLSALMKEARFREDLYYRINVIRIELPPLRDRRSDIGPLANRFVDRFNRELGRRLRGFTAAAQSALGRYPFPGNVRELENLVERACILAGGDLIDVDALGEIVSGDVPEIGQPVREPQGTLHQAERKAILEAIENNSGNLTRAAEELGISVRTLYTKRKEME